MAFRVQCFIINMDQFEQKLKPFLQPLVTRIDALEAENKAIREMCQNMKPHEKGHTKTHETHHKNVTHPIKSTVTPHDKPKEKEKENPSRALHRPSEENKKIESKVTPQVHVKQSPPERRDIHKEKPKSSQKEQKEKEEVVKSHQTPVIDKTKKSQNLQKKENVYTGNHEIPVQTNQKHLVKSNEKSNLIKEKHLNIEHKKAADLPQGTKDSKNLNKGLKHEKEELGKLHYKNLGDDVVLSHEQHSKIPNPETLHQNFDAKNGVQHNMFLNDMADARIIDGLP